ncbi:hypothetical protein TUM3794_20750 [Shewanella colwelliana]|uniref:Uncharacterized protein n=1 Tax=Shewanella colwelliana TaxID=23 RepID=A0ABQ4P0X8_SHECO|nr:hypothetical protein [Shewanella colwelliana]GIU41091.1 hypothetical protein TUM3794_20750 [Shewanella colwelliana]
MTKKLTYQEAKSFIREYFISSASEYKRFREISIENKTLLPSNPNIYYGKEWTSWNDFTGFETTPDRISFEELQSKVAELDIRTKEEFRLAVKTNEIDAPLNISKIEGFSNWSHLLPSKKYMELDELLTFTRKLNLRTQMDWRQWCKDNERPARVPFDLLREYQQQFKALKLKSKVSFWRYLFVGEKK